MSNGIFELPEPDNEPVKTYAPGSPERAKLSDTVSEMRNTEIEVPVIIGGEEIKTGNTESLDIPHDHSTSLGKYHKAGEKEVNEAIEAALEARKEWASMPWDRRASIFRRAADLLSDSWRFKLNAATMLNQSKTIHQAEIDSACELIDFWRFNVYFMEQIMRNQPNSSPGMWNRMDYRPLEGFIFAVTPFNFTSIAGNLPTSPAMIGNVVLWKPASSAVLSAYYILKLLEEAGLPEGVINFIPGSGSDVGGPVMESPKMSGIHFTGSTSTFQHMWETVGTKIKNYDSYPRIVGETGGKDFIFAHNSADTGPMVVAALRAAFEYQGQKCSAASRMYIPESLWGDFRSLYLSEVKKVEMGPVEDFSNFMSAVIDREAYENITSYIDYVKDSDAAEIIDGGDYDDSEGFFIEPTTVVTDDPKFKTMREEIFGPVLTIYIYEDEKFEETLRLCDSTSPYALTGAIWGRDANALETMSDALRNAAGNFYINDKPTAAVVGQQPFGGGRASGTNDKAGSHLNLLRWMTPRAIKETTVPPEDWKYPHMRED